MAITDQIRSLLLKEDKNSALKTSSKKKTITIAICSQKGGVGKTTTAVNLSAELAHSHQKRVLLVDLDAQGHVEKSLSHIVPEGLSYTPLSEVLRVKKGDIHDAIVKTHIPALHITPGDQELNATEMILAGKMGRELVLRKALAPALGNYDLILLDCPPNLGNLTVNALCAADYALIPCEMSVLAFEGVSDVLNSIEMVTESLNPKLKILGVVFTRVDGRNATMNQVVTENLKTLFKGTVFRSQINISTDLNKAQLEGVPVFQFSKSATGTKNYADLATEVVKKLKIKNSQKKSSVK